jgi:hypothetical protein
MLHKSPTLFSIFFMVNVKKHLLQPLESCEMNVERINTEEPKFFKVVSRYTYLALGIYLGFILYQKNTV